jgi:hypothetical protein
MTNLPAQLPNLVWYAGYGSNMRVERFLCYLQGGQIAGNVRVYPPCSDPAPPRRSERVQLPFQMYFGGESPAWGGGVSFIRQSPQATAIGRAYLISRVQFEHVVAQENHLTSISGLPIADALLTGSARVPEFTGRYDEIVVCGNRDGFPVFTFTSLEGQSVNRPATAYLGNIIIGLHELGLTAPEIFKYLSTTPGIQGRLPLDELRQCITRFARTS